VHHINKRKWVGTKLRTAAGEIKNDRRRNTASHAFTQQHSTSFVFSFLFPPSCSLSNNQSHFFFLPVLSSNSSQTAASIVGSATASAVSFFFCFPFLFFTSKTLQFSLPCAGLSPASAFHSPPDPISPSPKCAHSICPRTPTLPFVPVSARVRSGPYHACA